MADDAHLMAKLENLMRSPLNKEGAIEKYVEICFNHEYGIREPMIWSDLKTQVELRQFIDADPRNKEMVYDFIEYLFYRHGLGRGPERPELNLMDQMDEN